jgi:translation initiation factor IF-3
LGFRLLQRLAEDVRELGFVEFAPKQDGRNMIMVLGPHKKKTEAMAEARAAKDAQRTARRGVDGDSADEASATSEVQAEV